MLIRTPCDGYKFYLLFYLNYRLFVTIIRLYCLQRAAVPVNEPNYKYAKTDQI